MSAAGTPKTSDTPRQPTAAMSAGPTRATTTVPTLPPEMWALIAKPRRAGGNCSASSPLPTGCCGAPPMREAMLIAAKGPNDGAAAWALNPIPKRSPKAPISQRRDTQRVVTANVDWTRPDATAPNAATKAIVSTPTWNSSTTARKIRGRTTAWAWLTAWAIASSQRVRSGRISSSAGRERGASVADTATGYGAPRRAARRGRGRVGGAPGRGAGAGRRAGLAGRDGADWRGAPGPTGGARRGRLAGLRGRQARRAEAD
jgi:hypothetical protein